MGKCKRNLLSVSMVMYFHYKKTAKWDYLPSQDLTDYACFDFIGHLEDFRETKLLQDDSLLGYILKMRLITKPGEENFFTIDMYVTTENMRFKALEKGMKLTGLVQMQGEILK